MSEEKTTTPEVSTTPTIEELMKLNAFLSGGKSLDAIRLQMAVTVKAEAQKAAALALKAQVAEKLAPAIKAAHGIKVPRGIETAKISMSKDQATGLFTFNVNRATTWYNQKVQGLSDRELKLIGESVGKDKKVVDFVKSLYEDVYDAAVEKATFSLELFKPLTDECARTAMLATGTPIQVEFNFKWNEIVKDLPSGDKSVTYEPEWTLTSNLDKKDSTPKTTKSDNTDNGDKKSKGPNEKAPGDLGWYEYLQKRIDAGDVELKAWYDSGAPSDRPTDHKFYFKAHLEKKLPGSFTAWVKLDVPTWEPPAKVAE
jgi:hypothetical protein